MDKLEIEFGEVNGGKITIRLSFKSGNETVDFDKFSSACKVFEEFLHAQGWTNVRKREGKRIENVNSMNFDVIDPFKVNQIKNMAVDILTKDLPEIFVSLVD